MGAVLLSEGRRAVNDGTRGPVPELPPEPPQVTSHTHNTCMFERSDALKIRRLQPSKPVFSTALNAFLYLISYPVVSPLHFDFSCLQSTVKQIYLVALRYCLLTLQIPKQSLCQLVCAGLNRLPKIKSKVHLMFPDKQQRSCSAVL